MPAVNYNHGTRVLSAGETSRPIELANLTSIGALMTAPDATAAIPINEPFQFFTDDTTVRQALGATGTAADILDAIDDQGIVASVIGIVVPEGTGATPQARMEATISNMVGSSASLTGVHGFKGARSQVQAEPGVIIFSGYGSQRLGGEANPVVIEAEGVANRLKSMIIFDGPGTTKDAALQARADFTDGQRLYMIDPAVKVLRAGETTVTVQPASARVAGLVVKRDKQLGGPYGSPSNQVIGGITGPSRPISYYDGETDHEANYLNERRIATIIENRILWGNETLAVDPLWRFFNVRRTRDAIEKSIVRAFRWALDKNLGSHLAVAIIESVQEFLDELTAAGAILGGRAFFLRDQNSNASLRSGILRVEFDAEEAPPLQDLIFGSRRNAVYFDTLADDVMSAIERRAA